MPTIHVSSRMPIGFIALSFLTSLLYSYLLSHTERGLPLLDEFNIALYTLWFAVLAWVAWDVYRHKPSARKTLLFLACLVGLLTGFDLFDEEGSILLVLAGVMEALFLLAAYFSFPKVAVQK